MGWGLCAAVSATTVYTLWNLDMDEELAKISATYVHRLSLPLPVASAESLVRRGVMWDQLGSAGAVICSMRVADGEEEEVDGEGEDGEGEVEEGAREDGGEGEGEGQAARVEGEEEGDDEGWEVVDGEEAGMPPQGGAEEEEDLC